MFSSIIRSIAHQASDHVGRDIALVPYIENPRDEGKPVQRSSCLVILSSVVHCFVVSVRGEIKIIIIRLIVFIYL